MFNPASIPDMFSELVAQVSTTLGYTVNYKFGTWKVINDELKNTQNDKFPLIALLRGWRETPEDDVTMLVEDMKILIAVKSGETDQEQTRNDNSYLAVVFPIYKALCEAIADSYFFTGYNQNFKHSTRDWPNIGLENGERLLEDCSDGRLLENITLRVNMQECAYPKPVCYYTPCPNGRELLAITIFKHVDISGLGTSTLTVEVVDYDYVEAPPALPGPFLPELDPGTGGPATTMPANLIATIDTSGLQDGFYTPELTFGSASVKFYFKVLNGIIIHHTSQVLQTLTPTYDCQEYFDTNFHSFTVGLTFKMERTAPETEILNGYTMTLFGQTPVVQTFAPVDTIIKSLVRQTKYTEGNYLVINDISFSSQAPLRSVAYFKTQCS